jgi:SagB-type dehydrogenase family enzyme
MVRMTKQFGFLCTPLDDPRRIELRQAETLSAYHQRGALHDLIEMGHDLTKLRRIDRSRLLESAKLFEQPFMQTVEYTHDRDYPLQPFLRLPEPTIPDHPFGKLVRSRRSLRCFGGEPLGLDELSSLLFGAMGETGRIVTGHDDNDRPITASLRAIPSAGALHPTVIFPVILREGGLARGAYHYDVPEQSLELVKPFGNAECEELLATFPIHPAVVDLGGASAIFFISTKFWRGRAKYGPRAYRYCLQEVGCACQNLSLTAVALGLAHVVIGGFYDDEVQACLEIDGTDHAVITAVAVGTLPIKREDES